MKMNTTSNDGKMPIYKNAFVMYLLFPILAFGFVIALSSLFNVIGIKSGTFAVFIAYCNILGFLFLPSYSIALALYFLLFRRKKTVTSSQIFIPLASATLSFIPAAFVSTEITQMAVQRNSAIITILVTIAFVSIIFVSGYVAAFHIFKHIGKPLYEHFIKKTNPT